jgi:hypothetical protein
VTVLGLDHLIHVVADLDAAAAAYAEAGFTVGDRPDAPNGRSRTRFVVFADGSYIMLMQYLTAAAAAAHRLGPAAARGDGWADYALRSDDADTAARRLAAAGVPIVGPVAHTGALTTGAAWALRLVYAGRGATDDAALPTIVEDTAPRALRLPPAPAATRHANGTTGIADVRVIAAPGSRASAGLAALLAGVDAAEPGVTARFAIADATVTVVAPRHAGSGQPRPDDTARRGDGVHGVTLRGPHPPQWRTVAGASLAF